MTQLKNEIRERMQSSLGGFTFDGIESMSDAIEELCKNYIESFKDWYDTLSPRDKCTVWPPAGSGSGPGLYNMETKDLVDRFLRHREKQELKKP
jgi:hypothetical protein